MRLPIIVRHNNLGLSRLISQILQVFCRETDHVDSSKDVPFAVKIKTFQTPWPWNP